VLYCAVWCVVQCCTVLDSVALCCTVLYIVALCWYIVAQWCTVVHSHRVVLPFTGNAMALLTNGKSHNEK
jgi:hypothetical protein